MALTIVTISDAQRILAAQAWFGLVVAFLIGGLYWPMLLAWKPFKDKPMTEHNPTRRLWRAILVDQANRAAEPAPDPELAAEIDELDDLVDTPVG
jgi:hypothetical protein